MAAARGYNRGSQAVFITTSPGSSLTSDPSSIPPSSEPPPHSKRWLAALMLTVVLLGLTGYLTVIALLGDGRPIGCGDGSGCAGVLSSKWSKAFGVPVSGLATGLYLVVLVTLVTRKRLGGVLLAAAAAAVVGAAVWFTYVQVVEVQAICKYCMADHAIGLALAAVLLSATRAKALLPGVVVGLLGTAVLVGVQLNTAEDAFVVAGGGGERQGQTLTLLDGRLTLNLDEEIVHGDPESDRLLVKMYDYNCPHCRHAHRIAAELPGTTWVMLPVPMSPACNAYLPELPMAAMTHSCELARLALAIHRIDPGKLAAYDDWAYGEGWPHTAEQGRAFAETLVEAGQLDQQLADPALDAILKRNTDAWGRAKEADLVGGLPVFMAPGGGLTYGGIGDGTSLTQLLDGLHHSQTPDSGN